LSASFTRPRSDTPGYAFFNLAFCILYGLSVYNFIRAVTLDAGTAPKPSSDAELKEVSPSVGALQSFPFVSPRLTFPISLILTQVIEDLTSQGNFNGTNFCIVCMVSRVSLAASHVFAFELTFTGFRLRHFRLANLFDQSTVESATSARPGSTSELLIFCPFSNNRSTSRCFLAPPSRLLDPPFHSPSKPLSLGLELR
jgi:hypothetical protein